MKLTRAFTLVELLVVISIMSMLASLVMVRISLARADGRDATRTQQIRQIDLAVQMYTQDKGHAPILSELKDESETPVSPLCDIQTGSPNQSQASACFAVSTAALNTLQGRAWTAFKKDLEPYIIIPDDPCPTCTSSSNYPIGYTYVAPLAIQFYCINNPNSPGCPATNSSYQVYAPMERQTVPNGSGGSSSNYISFGSGNNGGGDVDNTPPTAPASFEATLDSHWNLGSLGLNFSWRESFDDVGVSEYRIFQIDNGQPMDNRLLASVSTNANSFIPYWGPGLDFCYIVRAYDVAENESDISNVNCTGTVPYHISPPQNVNSVDQGSDVTQLSWILPNNIPIDASNMNYIIQRNSGFGPYQTFDTSTNNYINIITTQNIGMCFTIKAEANSTYSTVPDYTSLPSQRHCID